MCVPQGDESENHNAGKGHRGVGGSFPVELS
jgi:hypothetical protein